MEEDQAMRQLKDQEAEIKKAHEGAELDKKLFAHEYDEERVMMEKKMKPYNQLVE